MKRYLPRVCGLFSQRPVISLDSRSCFRLSGNIISFHKQRNAFLRHGKVTKQNTQKKLHFSAMQKVIFYRAEVSELEWG